MGNISVSCAKKNIDILNFLFPGAVIIEKDFPSFPPPGDTIITVGRQINYPGKDTVSVLPVSEYKLDSRNGFLKFLIDCRKVKVSKKLSGVIEALPDEEFWASAKIASVLKRFPQDQNKSSATVFDLFKVLFDNFEVKYKVFRSIDVHYRVIFSSLLSMMLKVKAVASGQDMISVSPWYKKILLQHAPFFGVFKKALHSYLTTDKTEADFLVFLKMMEKV